MAAEISKKIHVAAQRLAGEQLFELGKQRLLCGRFRLVATLGRSRGCQRLRLEHLAVDLAAGQARHGRQGLEAGRHHVGRQHIRQAIAQRRAAGRFGAGGHVEGHQLVDALVIEQHHSGGPDAGLSCQHRLDFAQLHAKAANLDLVIRAAQALHLQAAALLFHAGQIAGAVEARLLRIAGPGVGQEFLGSQLGTTEVAGGHSGAGDAQFAGLAERQELQWRDLTIDDGVGIDHLDHQQTVVGQGFANGDRFTGTEFGQRGRNGGLGRSVGVEHLPPMRPAFHQRLRTHLAAQIDDAQIGHVLREQRQQRRHGMQHGDVVLDQGARQRFGIPCDLLGSDPQRGACQIADPDFLEGHVEGHRKTLVDLVIVPDAQPRVFAAQEMADAALGDGNALGLAGGAAGVDHVGRVVGRCAFAPLQHGALRQGLQQLLRRQDAGRDAGLLPHGLAVVGIDEQRAGLGIFQTDGNSFYRHFGIEGQPGCARLGNGELQHQQVDAARQPQADHVARPDAGLEQAVRHGIRSSVQFGIAQLPFSRHESDALRHAPGGRLEHICQDLLAQQLGQCGATQHMVSF